MRKQQLVGSILHLSHAFVLLFFVLGLHLRHADASESRCIDLGVNCVCSEPLQMTGFTGTNASFWNPNDSNDMECNGEGISPGFAITRNSTGSIDLYPSSDPVMLSAMPFGNTVARVLAGPEGHVGTWFMGHTFPGTLSFAKRTAARWYAYYSPTFGFDDDPAACNAAKLFQTDGNPFNNASILVDVGYGPPSLYNFLTFAGGTGAQDCCQFGALNTNAPASVIQAMQLAGNHSFFRGKWIRWEVVITNRDSGVTGNPVTFNVFVKNITDNSPEYLIASSCLPNGILTSPCAHIPIASIVFNKMLVNNYRQDVCPGFEAISHYMLAGWNTDSGQRIGASVEVEGAMGMSNMVPPAPPTGLRFK